MKKMFAPVLCMLFCVCASAQTHSFKFYPVADTAASVYRHVAGKLGKHVLLINKDNTSGLDLYVFDTVSMVGTPRTFDFPHLVLTSLTRENSIVFIGAYFNDSSTLRYRYLEIDENGDSLAGRSDTLNVTNIRNNIVISPNKKHILYYQTSRVNEDSALLRATMIGANGVVEKNIDWGFRHDKDRDDEPTVFVDNTGGTHVLVYDKFNNYKLSTDFTVNTLPFTGKPSPGETYNMRKIKLKTMKVFQDTANNMLSAQGMFVDGQIKAVRGIYNISFPVQRNNQLDPKFAEFTPAMIREFKKGYSLNDIEICNSLILEDFVKTDSGVYAVLRVDAQAGKFQPTRTTTISRSILPEMPLAPSKVVLRANTWNAPKLVYILMNKDNDFEWHTTKGQDIFRLGDFGYNNVLLGNDQHELMTVMYLADKNDDPQPVLVSFVDGKPLVENFADKYLTFTSLQSFSRQTYGIIYQNPSTGEGGILLIQQSPK